ncbi:MAG: redox-regulated ATPase YchF [Christensenellales bacterium]|jgi:GTP-binding protein YchF
MKLGVVGLPNVGKSTLFNAITKAGAQSANYPFCTIEPNVGVVAVPDDRLHKLAALYHPEKITPAIIEFVDIAGLVRGAHSGEGLGNRFLSHIREVDAIIQTVRCFDDGNIVHVDGSVDPIRDVETINFELLFADMDTVSRRIQRSSKAAKSGDRKLAWEVQTLKRIHQELESGVMARSISLNDEEQSLADSLFLLTAKPTIYVANISEDDIGQEESRYVSVLRAYAEQEGSALISICAKVEEELAGLESDEKQAFLDELGIGESGLDRLVIASYSLLGLISYLTAGPAEVRAWTIQDGTLAPQAAGKIHTDFERGFIRAEVIDYETLIRLGSEKAAKEQGLMRLEGRDYRIQDGDVIVFRFNV